MMVAIVAIVLAIVIIGSYIAYVNLASGTLNIELTDPPAGWGVATQVYLNYSDIEIHRADAGNESGWMVVVDQGGLINLTRTLDVNQTIGSENLQPGLYNLIRFKIDDALVTVGDQNFSALVPSDKLQIAITNGGINLNFAQTSTLLIELNITVHGSIETGFTLVPDVRAVPV